MVVSEAVMSSSPRGGAEDGGVVIHFHAFRLWIEKIGEKLSLAATSRMGKKSLRRRNIHEIVLGLKARCMQKRTRA